MMLLPRILDQIVAPIRRNAVPDRPKPGQMIELNRPSFEGDQLAGRRLLYGCKSI